MKTILEQKIEAFNGFTKDMKKSLNDGINRCKLAGVVFENEDEILNYFAKIEILIKTAITSKAYKKKEKIIDLKP